MKYIFWLHNSIPTEPATYVIDGELSFYSNLKEQDDAYHLLLEKQKIDSSIGDDNAIMRGRSEQLRFFSVNNDFFLQDATLAKNGKEIAFMFWADTSDKKEGELLLFKSAEIAGCSLIEEDYDFIDKTTPEPEKVDQNVEKNIYKKKIVMLALFLLTLIGVFYILTK